MSQIKTPLTHANHDTTRHKFGRLKELQSNQTLKNKNVKKFT